MRHPLTVLLLASLGCGDSTGPSEARLSGDYRITGEGAVHPDMPTFRVVRQTDERLIVDWIAGDIRGVVPVRDTAEWNVDAFRITWERTGPSPLYILRITGTRCEGRTFFDFGDSRPWSRCELVRP